MRFHVGPNTAGQYCWWLYSANNEMVAWAGEAFASEANARRAAISFKGGASSARFEVYNDVGRKPRWRAWRGGQKVAASGESFVSDYSAQRAADNVRANAGKATGP